jgi:gentisate 1,2-dioxygenase
MTTLTLLDEIVDVISDLMDNIPEDKTNPNHDYWDGYEEALYYMAEIIKAKRYTEVQCIALDNSHDVTD